MCRHAPTVIRGVECRPGSRDGVEYAIVRIPRRATYYVAPWVTTLRVKELSGRIRQKFETALTLAHLPARAVFEYA